MAAAEGGGPCACSPPLAAAEAVAADWMLEFACSCLCRHFGDESGAEFRRWSDVAQGDIQNLYGCDPVHPASPEPAEMLDYKIKECVRLEGIKAALINGFSKTPTHQKKRVYLCQLLIRIAKGKSLELQFENRQRVSPLESALYFWTLLEKEEIKLEKLHEDIHRLIQIQIVAVHMENGYFKEATEVLERLFTDSESDKPLRVKLATIIKNKDPYVPLLQSFSYSLLISKIKSYIELFMKENETNFLIQEATKYAESKGLEATALQNKSVNVSENDKSNLDTKQRFVKEQQHITNQSPGDIKNPTGRPYSEQKNRGNRVLQSLNNLQNVENHEVSTCGRRRQRWTYKEDLELKSGVKMFGVGNWAKILAHGDFNNRTGVMLKDRWRTLCRIDLA